MSKEALDGLKDDLDIEEVYIEDRELTDNGKAIHDVLRGLSLRDRVLAVLDYLGHDEDMMSIIVSRCNWEIANAIEEQMIADGCDLDEDGLHRLFGSVSYKRFKEDVAAFFPDEYQDGIDRIEMLRARAIRKELEDLRKKG